MVSSTVALRSRCRSRKRDDRHDERLRCWRGVVVLCESQFSAAPRGGAEGKASGLLIRRLWACRSRRLCRGC
jgi:hypothetical protein